LTTGKEKQLMCYIILLCRSSTSLLLLRVDTLILTSVEILPACILRFQI